MKPYLQVEDLTKSYGDRMLFEDVTFGVNEGDKIGIIAKNGTGKSTLLRILSGSESPDSGSVTFRSGIRVGFLDQEPVFKAGASLMDNLLPAIPDHGHEEWNRGDRVRQMLSQMGLNDADASVDHLSGGQLKRASLARVLLSEPDLLILDEPTNHLDMKTKDILKQAIRDFDGTVIVVSHDREFLNGLVSKVYEFGGGRVRECLGGIYEFLEKKRIDSLQELERNRPVPRPKAEKQDTPDKPKETAPDKPAARLSYAEQREREKTLKKAQKRVDDAENEITRLESEIASIEAEISAGNTTPDIFERHANATKALENAMSLWELAGMELEELKQRYS